MTELKNRFNELKISAIRLDYLSKTIDFLKQHGKVMIVRMPVSKVPYAIENSVVPDFDKIILNITKSKNVPYINYNNYPNDYQWVDEVHLEPASMDKFSEVIAKDFIR